MKAALSCTYRTSTCLQRKECIVDTRVHNGWLQENQPEEPFVGDLVEDPMSAGWRLSGNIDVRRAFASGRKYTPEATPNEFECIKLCNVDASKLKKHGYVDRAWPKGVGVVMKVDTTIGLAILIEHAATSFRFMTKVLAWDD